jgi:hypothetical protein
VPPLAGPQYTVQFRDGQRPEADPLWRSLQRRQLPGPVPRFLVTIPDELLPRVLESDAVADLVTDPPRREWLGGACPKSERVRDEYVVNGSYVAADLQRVGAVVRAGPFHGRTFIVSLPSRNPVALFLMRQVWRVAPRCLASVRACAGHQGSRYDLRASDLRNESESEKEALRSIVIKHRLRKPQYFIESVTVDVPREEMARLRRDPRVESLEAECPLRPPSRLERGCSEGRVPNTYLVALPLGAPPSVVHELERQYGAHFSDSAVVGKFWSVTISDDKLHDFAFDPRVEHVEADCYGHLE